MTTQKRPYVTPRAWVWHQGDDLRIPGIGLMRGPDIRAHLTPTEARKLADRLHDLADKLDTTAAHLNEPTTPARKAP